MTNQNQYGEKIAEMSKTIFLYCMSKTHSRQEAEDLSQDILCELIKASGNIRDESAFYGFMWAVAGNVYKQWVRKQTNRKECELTEDIPIEDTLHEEEDTDIYLLRRELTLLSEKYRRATILYYVDKKSCSEIADILGISESMVKYLLFKARQIMKEGMTMERKLGTLSYNPITLNPMYNGSGPNRFWDFMQSKIRQNIVNACYNDTLTAEQISLETGIPLPYLEDDLRALWEKEILIKDGTHYKTNVLIITADCGEEIKRAAVPFQDKIADKIEAFLDEKLDAFKSIGFMGADFSENTLRWQLMTFVMTAITFYGTDIMETNNLEDYPVTAWGEHAYLWLVENSYLENHIFEFLHDDTEGGDSVHVVDYRPKPKGSHMDLYGNSRDKRIFCDIAHGKCEGFSEYDLEAVAELIRKGYVVKEDTFRVTTPVFTKVQYEEVVALVKTFVEEELGELLTALEQSAVKVLSEHTPKHLQSKVKGIASMDKMESAVCVPVGKLIERKVLSTAWHPLEMPTTYIVLHK